MAITLQSLKADIDALSTRIDDLVGQFAEDITLKRLDNYRGNQINSLQTKVQDLEDELNTIEEVDADLSGYVTDLMFKRLDNYRESQINSLSTKVNQALQSADPSVIEDVSKITVLIDKLITEEVITEFP